MTEKDVIEIFGKSIWDMSADELVRYKLVELWAKLINETYEDEIED